MAGNTHESASLGRKTESDGKAWISQEQWRPLEMEMFEEMEQHELKSILSGLCGAAI